MTIEQLDIRDHMAQFAPFDNLPDEWLDRLAAEVEIQYFPAGAQLLTLGNDITELFYVRSGAVEIKRRSGQLFDRLSEGAIFGYSDLLRHRPSRYQADALEDTLIYFLPAAIIEALNDDDEGFAEFLVSGGQRLKASAEHHSHESNMLTTRVRRLIVRRPLMVAQNTPLQRAAQLMREQSTSSLLVIESTEEVDATTFVGDDQHQWHLVGMLTDRDCCTRVVADGIDPQTPVSEVMSKNLVRIQADESVYEAMLTMLRNNIQHLPVLYRRRPMGVLQLSDIVRHETHSSLYLVSNIFHQTSVEGLGRLSAEVRKAFVRLVDDGANSGMIGRALATIGRSVIRRLLELAEESYGPPPVPYAFMVLGSMARDEPTITADQDHALVIDDAFVPEEHDVYFEKLAVFVREGMAACGYARCKGDIMASNSRWRQPFSVWREYFTSWIDEPSPERLLHSSIFFDLTCVFGEDRLVEPLQELIADLAPKRPLFLAAMARNALGRTPPLGFFRTFVVEKDGEHRNSINIKRRGTAPLADLIRVHALACGSKAQNSFLRLDDIANTTLLAEGVNDRLRYSFELLSMVRIRHQALDLQQEREPDNNVEPDSIPSRDRHHLKDAFEIISHAQKFMAFRYPMPSRSGKDNGSRRRS
ncbi:DUF294 nucleotidyltransferase-like domain-containing protein [Larsenimonas rhizosphaerae]|uniref:DUF294 nucleotidyltransferase-like domain-containing protein n=1 Tax=Larsenimonas rhizosphaerae TaxID=2944682 RepID=A0AA42CUB7_9GAMM|nr:DUF294 nucleotidyltransferase-like domain-containing protein [Larsenimonas rhizosphaerae]MCM2129479.1 DUF294 nucleotidyltransferase-like domain-containing protein [Larsenimonas rhizosphaerae]MCX2524134.1 DUF294 nucleotidyltransferase-like domain-containing protein [Larsenimonas rhizosphaerae]